jgi:hypothetical protein
MAAAGDLRVTGFWRWRACAFAALIGLAQNPVNAQQESGYYRNELPEQIQFDDGTVGYRIVGGQLASRGAWPKYGGDLQSQSPRWQAADLRRCPDRPAVGLDRGALRSPSHSGAKTNLPALAASDTDDLATGTGRGLG